MARALSKLWFSDRGMNFTGDEPCYFDRSLFPWVERIEAQWATIRAELLELAEQEQARLVPYPIPELTSKKDHWKTFGLMFWNLRSKTNCEKAPKTWEIVRTIPNVIAASFNVLEGGATIKPHIGDTNAIARCHMGLVIPAPAPQCAFRVGKEVRSWKEGEFLMFCDAHVHTAWNNTEQKRYIMIVDVLRPEFVARKYEICSRVLARIEVEILYKRRAWLRRLCGGRWGRALVTALHRGYFWSVLRLELPEL